MKKKLSLVFFGSGPVAAASLELLVQDFSIEAIITKPSTQDEMSLASPDTPLFTVNSRSDLEELIDKENFGSKVGVLIDFGIIVSQRTIGSFKMGIVNSHFSLLPELRGADPISFAILEGKQKTGVSLMLLVEAMDEGPILAKDEIELKGSETTPQLTKTLIEISYRLLKDNLSNYLSGRIKQVEQKKDAHVSYTRKLTKEDGIIDWRETAIRIEREIRAYSGWPRSRSKFNSIEVVLTAAEVVNKSGPAGKLFIVDGDLAVYCGSGAIKITQLIPAGKKLMDSKAFLAGYKSRLNL